jgi:hypothetical protein
MYKKLSLAAGLLLSIAANAQGPEVTSWMINTTGLTGYNNLPANVQLVQYSTSNVYVSCSDIPAYTIGPWSMNPNTPSNQGFVYKLTRNPQQNTGTPVATPLGHMGVWINGVSIYNAKDAFTYNNQGIWHQDAIVVEGMSFDNCKGHPTNTGEYHHHQNPTCLYTANTSAHSPLLGYAFDGFPVYGPYAYQNTNGTGNITRMRSSYSLRNITQRTSLPDGTQLSASQYGPNVSTQYPLGYYIEDYEYIQGSGDLDEHNGRFCVTPEYPNGIYAYFVTINTNGSSAYPYTIGPTYYGTVQAGNTGPGSGHNTVSEPVTTYTSSTGISEQDNDEINIYPVPAGDELTIDLSSYKDEISLIQLCDVSGRIVMEVKQPGKNVKLDTHALSKGTYMINIRPVNNVAWRKKIIKL